MTEKIPQAPVPPPRFSSENGYVRVATSLDTLGQDLLRDEAGNLDREFKASDEADAEVYWRDMREFYGIDEADAENLTLEDAAEKYDFTPASRDHLKQRHLGAYSLKAAHEDSNYWANSDLSHNKEWLESGIERLRDRLSVTLSDPRNNLLLYLYMEEHAPPIFDSMRRTSEGDSYGWSQWLTDKAEPEQFMNFLQWHNYRMREFNANPETQANIDREKTEYIAAVEKFVDQGELPAGAVDPENVNACTVYIGDVFTTLMQGRGGYYPSANAYPRNRYVLVDESHIEHATKHELNHAVLEGFEDRWLNEATTEHLAVSMRNGKVEPVGDQLYQGVYFEEREVLDVVMTHGSKVIPTKTLLWGYAEKTSRWGKDQFKKAVDESWGHQALYKIQSAIAGHEARLILKGKTEQDAQKGALIIVRSDLLQQPAVIFGESYTSEEALV